MKTTKCTSRFSDVFLVFTLEFITEVVDYTVISVLILAVTDLAIGYANAGNPGSKQKVATLIWLLTQDPRTLKTIWN